MFRLVVIHQLVLSLVVGPMLCCCTAARLGHDANPVSRTTHSGDTSHRKPCCGQGQKQVDGGRQVPAGDTPSDPTKCPCQKGSAKAAVAPNPAPGSADALHLLGAAVPTDGLPVPFDGLIGAPPPNGRIGAGSAFLSTSDLLFAHHKLRC